MEEQDVMAMHAEGGEASQQSLHPMAELLEQGYGQVLPKRGDAVEGVIVAVSPSEILIDIGSKCEGIVTSRDLDQLDPSYRKSLRVGDTVLAYVIRPEDANGNVVLSLSRAMLEGVWREAAKMMEADEVFERRLSAITRAAHRQHRPGARFVEPRRS